MSGEGRPAGLGITVEYAADLYDAATAEGLAGRLLAFLAGAVACPDVPVGDLDLLVMRGGRGWRGGPGRWCRCRGCRLDRLFSAVAGRHAGRVALVFEDQEVSYGELEAWSNRLARHLGAAGVRPGGVVGVHLERSPALVAALLGVLKAGAAYTVLDPLFPAGRLEGRAGAGAGGGGGDARGTCRVLAAGVPVVDLTAEAAVIAARPGGPAGPGAGRRRWRA